MDDKEIAELLRIAAEAALKFAREYPEVVDEYPSSNELIPYWIADLVLLRIE